ncbi:MAG: hypothetical protein ACYS80_19060 [Planctomycetota bacterium]|jgi:hypothetical protein
MKRTALHIIITIYFSVLLLACPAFGSVPLCTRFSLDLTKPTELAKKATWKSPQKNVRLTKEGLTFNEAENASADVWIQIKEPIAVGLYWRTVQSVYIKAQIDPPNRFFIYHKKQSHYPKGELYARYSADALHWSDWQYLALKTPIDPNETKQQYAGRLMVPLSQQQRYEELLSEYRKLDIPWKSDEEAAVEWILKSKPNFFEKPAPFIGYVQFLYETNLRGGHCIKNLTFTISSIVNGMYTKPKNFSGYNPSFDIPWRFKAAELRDNKKPDSAN